MKVLVIHPKDRTTDFLSVIYEGMDWTVIRELCSKSHLKRAIKEHDFIIMLGHGSDKGLFGFKRMLIDSTLVYLLREKPNSMYVWCNADKFTTKYGLRGFCTGMIISDYEEALNFAVNATDEEITISNQSFAKAVRNALVQIFYPDLPFCESVRSSYEKVLVKTGNPVIDFNIKNINYR